MRIDPWPAIAAVIGAATVALLTAAGLSEDPDPDLDGKAVQAVCGRCHSTALFEKKPRSWERWNDVFADMTQRGATGSDEELMRVTRYFLENLTLINVNKSSSEELAGVLGVPDEVAQAIIARRQQRPFIDLKELCAVPGVNADTAEKRKARILF